MPSTFLVPSVCKRNLRLRDAAQGHHNVHTGFETIGHMVQKFKCYTHTRTRKQHADVKIWRLENFPSSKLSIMLLILLYSLSVCSIHLLNRLTECHDI